MFEPQKNRVDYGNLLTPPDGFELDFAVCTTYSLDFDAFIGACMSLGLGEDTESELLNDPIFMLDVLHKTSDKIALFCEGGQIHSPSNVTMLYALLESSVQQVSIKEKKGVLFSFHPKFWLISYKNKNGDKKYSLIVTSRNLTFDRSWDVVISLNGYKTNERVRRNQPVKDFLGFLQGYLAKTPECKHKNRKIQELISDLDHIEFKTEGNIFDDVDFIPLGIGGEYSIKNYPLFGNEQYHELFAMSPFLSRTTVKELNDRWEKSAVKPVLITRKQSLDEVKGCGNFDVCCMRPEVVYGEEQLGGGRVQQQDIHAKLYMIRQSDRSDAQLYLGSMNASYNAMHGNVEFMVRLTCKGRHLDLEKLKNQLIYDNDNDHKQNPFEKVDIGSIEVSDKADENLDCVIRSICRSSACARVEQNGEKYNIVLDTKCKEYPCTVTVSPLFSKKVQSFKSTMTFEDLVLKELSQFYKIVVVGKEKTVERIIVIPTAGIPENRDDAVISSIIPDTKSFYAYLSFVLGNDPVLDAVEATRVLQGVSDGRFSGTEYSAALYEKMLKAAATDPEKLSGINYLMKAVSKDGIVPDKFIKLYAAFQKAVKR